MSRKLAATIAVSATAWFIACTVTEITKGDYAAAIFCAMAVLSFGAVTVTLTRQGW